MNPGQTRDQRAGGRPGRCGGVAQMGVWGRGSDGVWGHGSDGVWGVAQTVGAWLRRVLRMAQQPGGMAGTEGSGQGWELSLPHLGRVHTGGQEGLGCAIGQRQVLRQETPELLRVSGHRVQREGRHWTGRKARLRGRCTLARCPTWARSRAQHHSSATAACAWLGAQGRWRGPGWTWVSAQ